ncbi:MULTISPECIES: SusC/RagA family TonB-linked outer membrane protein [Aestuariibaculum]|uniref:SusC/RagA family TonB-linked outer membrane protein n=1 Tax=Aestuariibaculum marinum TaxID=2683592 RepID=A0A8J6UA73_9FLAO|nr:MULTISPECIES: SusC/RagA family TonB-linked outer membrane protein [Aestuariibaculum]MBD0824471.1 SusC/RagA family TonB-linked outer membrane protein [Aestuariibaculum marinum]WMI64622.1 SusC/RagA family TonB-linked outer membrane protein [Aestuariibaculum sp. YM273]
MKYNITNLLYSFSLVLIFFTSFQLSAQSSEQVLRGQVIDAGTKEPILGATVIEQDAENRTITGVVTDFDGNFAIRIKSTNNKLVISTIGYTTQVLEVGNRRNFDIQLVEKVEGLDEIVITGSKGSDDGLLNIAERNLTTSVVTVKASDIENTQAASIDEALQGRVAGVDITANSGDPGAGMQIRIRGTSSINGSSDPLIVVDGMPYETSIPEDFNFGTADQQGYAALLNVAPSDIESITILKDAAATAMWGARAAAGVLIINTKRGSVGSPKIGYTFTGTYMQMPNTIPMLNGDQYSQLIPEAYMNRTGTPLPTSLPEFQYDPQEVYYYKNYGNNTDWVDAITQTGLTGEHNISLQGGGERARYYSSVGYYNSRGVTKGTAYERINGRLNLDYVVSDRIRFKADISYTHSDTDRNYVNGTSNGADRIRSVAYVKMPNMSIYEYDDVGDITPNYFSPAQNIQGQYSGTYNPVAMAEFATNNQIGERIVPHFNLKVDLVPDRLISTFDIQYDFNSTKAKSFLPQNATGRPFTETVVNRAADSDVDVTSITTKTNFIYTPQLGEKHSFQSILSLQSNDVRVETHEALTSNTASSLLTDPSVPSRTQNSELVLNTYNGQSRNVGALINAQYGYDDRYLFNVGLRADGNSKFGPDNRYALFPSVSTRWRVSAEKFMESLDWVDDFSVRASLGQSGRAPRSDYRYFNIYSNYPTEYLGLNGIYPANIQLNNLRWETLIGKNLGFNIQLFDKRVMMDIDIYKNRTKDLLFRNIDITTVSGYSNLSDQNVGTLDNQGWEIGLNTTPFKNDKWTVDFNFNISRNQNVIREISEFYPNESGNIDRNGEYKRFLQVDNPFGSFYGYRFKGVYPDLESTKALDANGNVIVGPNGQEVYMRFNYPNIDYTFQPGDAIYEDINKDGNIDSRDIVYLGNSNPKFSGGFGPSFSYNRQFKLQLFFTYRLDYDIINGTDMITTNMYGFDNQSKAVLSRWRNPGDVTDMPRAVYRGGYNWLGSSRYVEDASFLRFRSATFSYNFGKKFLKSIKLDDLNLFFTADNIMTFTKYRGQDPEVGRGAPGVFGISIDNSRTPPTRRFTLGLRTRF